MLVDTISTGPVAESVMSVQAFLFNPFQAQAVMMKAAIEMSRESQNIAIDAIKRAGQSKTSPVTWVSFEVPVADPRGFFNEDAMRATFHRMADQNLRGWEYAAELLKTMPSWVSMSTRTPGTVLTDWFDQMRRASLSMMPANDAWATSDNTPPAMAPRSAASPATRPAALTPVEPKPQPAARPASKSSAPAKAAAAAPGAEAARAKPARKAPAKPATPKQDGPARLDAPRGKADDLTAIKGIGEKLASLLNTLGIYHYDQIAGWTVSDSEWIDTKLAFKGRVAREKWVEQAKALVRKAA